MASEVHYNAEQMMIQGVQDKAVFDPVLISAMRDQSAALGRWMLLEPVVELPFATSENQILGSA